MEEEDYQNIDIKPERCPAHELDHFAKMLKEVKSTDCIFLCVFIYLLRYSLGFLAHWESPSPW